ncbi:MAG TPA: hypothetical protein VH416_02515 [Gaiellaceae bacterium]|jgi:hypothetical protein
MRSLAELLADDRGVAFLEQRGVFVDDDAFASELREPERADLAGLLGLEPDCRLVYVGQQVCADLGAATAAKFATARDAADRQAVTVAVLWHDMDSTQSERYGARVVLPSQKKTRGVWLIDRELEDHEPRFVPVDREHLEAVVMDIASWARSSVGVDRRVARARMSLLSDALLDDRVATLADANRAIVSLLLREELGLEAPDTFASEMIAHGLLVDSVAEYVSAIEEVVPVFNEAIERLAAEDVDPQLRPLPPDYLPLRFSCPKDGTRLRLSREVRGDSVHATATCRCHTRYEFDLGRDATGLGELGRTGRWSIDVSMPVHHNDLASGWVAGRSGGLYAIAFNEVLERVFARRPIPVLVPRELPADSEAESSLLVRWLVGRRAEAASAT